MSAHDNGGPAFPVHDPAWLDPRTVAESKRAAEGMSLRDYAAIHLPTGDGLLSHHAERLVGRPMPRPVNGVAVDPMENVRFWIEAEMAYRFQLADAFIAARSKA